MRQNKTGKQLHSRSAPADTCKALAGRLGTQVRFRMSCRTTERVLELAEEQPVREPPRGVRRYLSPSRTGQPGGRLLNPLQGPCLERRFP